MRAAAWLGLVAGCALTGKSPPRQLRYFAPIELAASAPPSSACTGAPAPLRLGTVRATAGLRERIVHRDSPVETGAYATLRWSERPDAYARRAIARALFDRAGLAESADGDAPVLQIDVLAFEELRRGAARAGRVRLGYELRDEHAVIARGQIDVERPAPSPSIDAVVGAIGAALDDGADQVAARVARCLCARAEPPR